MIEASFEAGRGAAVSGAYQHDRGQRLRLHGLPPPDVLSQMDELIEGETVTVQAQYAFAGDSQTEMRIAVWDEAQGVWTAAVPDVYMARSEEVHVYVYVSYGQNGDGQRAKTCYEAVFRPVSRPAPGDNVTPGQISAWDALVQEVNLALAEVSTAASNANASAQAASESAQAASQTAAAAAQNANSAAERIAGMTASAVTLAPGSAATASVEGMPQRIQLVIGVPKGDPGVCEINGIAVTESGSVTLTPGDIGALPADTALLEQVLYQIDLPADGWTQGEDGRYAQEAAAEGMLETDAARIDLDMTGATAETADALLEAWGRVSQAQTMNGGMRAICLREPPEIDMTVKVWVIR